MQFTQIISKKSIFREYAWQGLKILIFIFLLGFIWSILKEKNLSSGQFWSSLFSAIQGHKFLTLLVFILLLLNWGLEAIKWQYLVKKVNSISALSAYKGVLTGVALGFASPHGLGDYFGRILQLSVENRQRLTGAVLLARISQFIITCIFGAASLVIYFYIKNDALVNWVEYVLIVLSIVTIVLSFVLFSNKTKLVRLLRINAVLWEYVGLLTEYEKKEVLYVFFLSLFRYLVFTFQFILLLWVFNIKGGIGVQFLGVNLIFLAKSTIPTFFELGVREFAATYFFSQLGIATDQVLQASLFLWFVNIVLPSVVGSMLVFKMKLKVKQA